ncbi:MULTISPECIES: glycosyltransferase family 2 protein [Cohnella]|uniref:glycosyltransferase family 2 protein n=1 Tax=Cohnella TaxID=329857 RepID=UPI0009BC4F9A|nr:MULTISPECIES: glycosyltransferase family 2 protein [Cohnella]MBN2982931.1 glycosyltransferase family 2 protein [Cohnella algarum]
MGLAKRPARSRRSRRPPRSDPARRKSGGKAPSRRTPARPGEWYDRGYQEGYREGVQVGLQRFHEGFEGTSIIIPTYNQLALLKECIRSIMDNTNVPYEIIVVDNASADGTAAYLRSLGGQVRFRALDANRGFAGAINVGLMMAKGSTLLLLNNDTLVTERWLDNMLACLNSDERIGMVGPVSNCVSGDQQITVPYDHIGDMPRFAAAFNRSDASRWRRTDRLVGFCLLFRRELFEQIGYFDEGFELGNFEDDDYGIRVRLLGRNLVVAEDTFIHHFGSVSLRAIGEQFARINDRNHLYFNEKWQHPYEWIHRVLKLSPSVSEPLADMSLLYPERIAVQGIGAAVYWVEDGMRHSVEGELSLPVTRISQIDLKRWPIGGKISGEEASARWFGEATGVVMLPDGTLFYREADRLRRIVSLAAMQAWHLHLKKIDVMQPEEAARWAEGLPIVAPPVLRQRL